jgi:tetratricopeptide (TPR) repeat protein
MAKRILGMAYYLNGNIKEARAAFQQVSASFKSVSLYTSSKYIFEQHHGNIELAMDYLKYLLESRKTNWVPPSIIANISFSLGKVEQAMEYYKKAIDEKDPGVIYIYIDPVCRLGLGVQGRAFVEDHLRKIGLIKLSK